MVDLRGSHPAQHLQPHRVGKGAGINIMRSISYMRGRPSVDDDALIDGRVSAEAQAEIGWPLLGFFAARSLHGFSAGGSASTPTHGCEPADHSHSLVRRLAMNESAILLGLLEARSMSKVGKGGDLLPRKGRRRIPSATRESPELNRRFG